MESSAVPLAAWHFVSSPMQPTEKSEEPTFHWKRQRNQPRYLQKRMRRRQRQPSTMLSQSQQAFWVRNQKKVVAVSSDEKTSDPLSSPSYPRKTSLVSGPITVLDDLSSASDSAMSTSAVGAPDINPPTIVSPSVKQSHRRHQSSPYVTSSRMKRNRAPPVRRSLNVTNEELERIHASSETRDDEVGWF